MPTDQCDGVRSSTEISSPKYVKLTTEISRHTEDAEVLGYIPALQRLNVYYMLITLDLGGRIVQTSESSLDTSGRPAWGTGDPAGKQQQNLPDLMCVLRVPFCKCPSQLGRYGHFILFLSQRSCPSPGK